MSDTETQVLDKLTLGGLAADPQQLDEADRFQPGDVVGPYRIIRLAGAGGMGVVYLAEQLSPVQRRLALKFVRRKGLGDLADAYFLVERQALAQLDHPGIAVLYDAGRIGGLLYFAMEWVDGAPIDSYAQAESLDQGERLRLFIRVCRAMHHAHTRGIIHRDLKPANILVDRVDERPSPKIIDFGIALLGSNSETQVKRVRDRAGTRAYMSPEQSERGAEIDMRSDVYALGVVLFVLLTEHQASIEDQSEVSGQDVYQLLGHSTTGASVADAQALMGLPVEALAKVPMELRAVVRKSLAPVKEDRYDSALALATDLERYLGGYPLEAVKAGQPYRLRKFLRRHVVPTAAAAAVLLALLAGLGAALYGLRSAEVERARAIVEADRANAEAQRAERISAFLQSVLSSADPSVAGDMDKTLMRSVLEGAAGRAESELADDPAMLAAMEGVIGRSFRGLGDPEKAVEALERARQRQQPVAPEIVRDLAMALDDLGQSAEAVKAIDDWLETAAGDDPVDRQRLELRSHRAEYLMRVEGPAAALAEAQSLLAPVQAEFGADDEMTLRLRNTLARALSRTGEIEQALKVLEDVATRQLRVSGPSDTATLHVQGALAIGYLQAERFDQALQLTAEILPRSVKVYGENHQAVLSLYSLQGSALKGLGRMREAAEAFKLAFLGFRDKFGERHPHVVGTSFNYAQVLIAAEDFAAADQLLADASSLAPEVFGPEHPLLFDIALAQGRSALRAKRWQDAERLLLALDQTSQGKLDAKHPISQEKRGLLEELYEATGRPDRAEQWRSDGP